MSVVYLRSTDGNDADSGATWALAKATLASALTAAGAGGTVYVSHVHAETQASAMTLTSPGTAASPVLVICVNDGAEPPTALATTATVTVNAAASMGFNGFAYCYGIAFYVGNGTTGTAAFNFQSTSPWWWRLHNCSFNHSMTNQQSNRVGAASGFDDQLLELINTSFQGSGHLVMVNSGRLVWRDSPTAQSGFAGFGRDGNTPVGIIECTGVNFDVVSTLTVGNAVAGRYLFQNCKLKSGVTFVSLAISGQGGHEITVVNCDSADTNYRFYRQTYQGTITSEPVIVKTGGSSDGTTPFSRKFVSTANSKIYSPLEGLWTTFWNETVGSAITVAADVVTDGVTLTDAEAWIEVEYLGNGSFPISTTTTDRVSDIIFGTPANQTTSSATWTTTGLASPTKQTLSVSITPQEKGPIRARVCLAKASTTMYADQIVMSGTSGRQYMIGAEGIVNEGASGAFNPLGGMLV